MPSGSGCNQNGVSDCNYYVTCSFLSTSGKHINADSTMWDTFSCMPSFNSVLNWSIMK